MGRGKRIEGRDLAADTQAFIDQVAGTALTAQQALEQLGLSEHYDSEGDLDTDAVDEAIFECSVCGWWCWRDEESEREPGQCDDHDDEEE